ncbi:MAG TPA: hypothetical protein VHU61_06770 [Solirubrobacteraceae bacterium]|nr:hypothetical protein [Solirubrobacteraceae bacterium]
MPGARKGKALGQVLTWIAMGVLWCLAAPNATAAVGGHSAGTPGYHGAASFERGFADSVWIWSGNANTTPAQWDAQAYGAGAGIVEVEVDWGSYEPKPPLPGVSATDSGSADYSNWSGLDPTVETLEANNLKVMFLVTDAPTWADSGTASQLTDSEGYDINMTALENFMRALAGRYAGSYPDPTIPGVNLPRVQYYQDWAEANNTQRFGPQWANVDGDRVNEGAILYRESLNAFYAGVKAADESDVVIFTGLEPWGDPPGGQWVAPTTFLENVLCMNAKLVKQPCAEPAHFDVLAADPYEDGNAPPTQPAQASGDVQLPDLGKLERIMDAAVAARTVLPQAHKPIWVTEFGYQTKAPNPYGEKLSAEALWQEEAFYEAWKEGVSVFLWYLIRDWPGANYIDNWFSGVYTYNDAPKPSYLSYKFPFVVVKDGAEAQMWGMSPAGAALSVQEQVGGSWRTIKVFHPAFDSVFTAKMKLPSKKSVVYRAVQGNLTSLPWEAHF